MGRGTGTAGYALLICLSRKKKRKCDIVAEITTLRRHLQAYHSVQSRHLRYTAWILIPNSQEAYHVWAKANDFMSMLPRDTDARRKQLAKQKATQSTLTLHLREKPPPPSVVKYTDALFRDAAIEWLIATDQVRKFSCVVFNIS